LQIAEGSTTAIVDVKNVSYSYNNSFSSSIILNDISFKVKEGDLLGIIGPNGAGKTTLFQCMLGLLKDYYGEITIFGEDTRRNKLVLKKIAYIRQKNFIDRSFPATVNEIVSLGTVGIKALSKEKEEDKILSVIESVGLFEYRNKRIGQLSGGQQQRVLIAKALIADPALLILDEPTTGIDQSTQDRFYALLKSLNHEKNITIIWSSHDLGAVNKLANKVACINKNMFFHGNAYEFFENEKLLKAYSESAMQAHMQLHLNKNPNSSNSNSNNNGNNPTYS
jgi:zinc transport system ATP-binding protein